MRRADRLFDIIQVLRTAKGPVTAETLAKHLEVTVRTVYRDVATLQARRVPIEGAAGIGYMLRRGFDLPPLMFSTDEIEAIAVAMRMLRRTGDAGLQAAAETVLSKVTVAIPDALRAHLTEPPFVVSRRGAPPPPVADLAAIRAAIREERKLRIGYGDETGTRTERTIWPFAIAYFAQSTLVNAWCELRDDFRHFRADRILDWNMLDEGFPISGKTLFARWQGRFGFEDKTNANIPTRSSQQQVTAKSTPPAPAQLRRQGRQ
jgi:predicted DNA-binding transcriptional regulator YafY